MPEPLVRIDTGKFRVVPSSRGSGGIVAAIVTAHDAGLTAAEIADRLRIDIADVFAVLTFLESRER